MSEQPRKQRNKSEHASLHERHSEVRAHLSEDLHEEYGQRRVRVNAGDTVEVMRGDDAGTEAEVARVDLRSESVFVEDVTVEKADGEEVTRAVDASNLRVTELDLEDDVRAERLEGENE